MILELLVKALPFLHISSVHLFLAFLIYPDLSDKVRKQRTKMVSLLVLSGFAQLPKLDFEDHIVLFHIGGAILVITLHFFIFPLKNRFKILNVTLPLLYIGTAFFGGMIHKGTYSTLYTSTLIIHLHFISAHFIGLLLWKRQKKELKKTGTLALLTITFSGVFILWKKSPMIPIDWLHLISAITLGLSLLVKNKKIHITTLLFATCTGVITSTGFPSITHSYSSKLFEEMRANPDIIKGTKYDQFKNKVYPVIERRCLRCHGGNSSPQNSIFTYPAILQYFGTTDPTSPILNRISKSPQRKHHMPFLEGNLSENEFKTIKEFIVTGGLELHNLNTKKGSVNQNHWFFKAPTKKANVTKSLAKEYEALLNKKEEKYKKRPLEKSILLRKLSLLLTGKNPTWEDYQLFINGKISYDELIEKYLSSKDFGIQFTTTFLDFITFADTKGMESNEFLPGGDKFRQNIVDSFNDDKNYLQVLKTIMKNKGLTSWFSYQPAFSKDKVQTLNIVSNNFFQYTLGYNSQCAQCHNHKYIPLSNEENYSRTALFAKRLKIDQSDIVHYRKRLAKHPSLQSKYTSQFKTPEQPMRSSHSLNDIINQLTNSEKELSFFIARNYVNYLWSYFYGRPFYLPSNFNHFNRPESAQLKLLNLATQKSIDLSLKTKDLVRMFTRSSLFKSSYQLEKNSLLQIQGPIYLTGEQFYDLLISSTRLQEISERALFIKRPRDMIGRNPLAIPFFIPRGYQSTVRREILPSISHISFFMGKGLLNRTIQTDLPKLQDPLFSQVYFKLMGKPLAKKTFKILKDNQKKGDLTDPQLWKLLLLTHDFLKVSP